MYKTIKNLLKCKIVSLIIIPFVLFLSWLGFTVYYIAHLDTGLSVLSYNSSRNSFMELPKGKLLKGNVVSGVFQAADNNLGIVSIRFQTFFRPVYADEDRLLFQIKQKGAKQWYYQNTYQDGLVYEVPFFPFGFPIIKNSKGKMYEFKIISLNGNDSNSIAVSNRNQILATKYQYSKSELLHNKKLLLTFLVKKFVNAMQTTDVFFSSLIYLLPFIFYILLLSAPGRRLLAYIDKNLQQQVKTMLFKQLFPKIEPNSRPITLFFDIILLGSSLIDIFYLQLGNDLIFVLIPILWIVVQSVFSFTSKKTFIIGISLLFFPPIFLQFKLGQIAENAAVWAFLFLCAGFIQSMIELKQVPETAVIARKKRNKFSIIQSRHY